jgi:hypothetical protein
MTTLLTIQHDPKGILLKPLKAKLSILRNLFTHTLVVITPTTHPDYVGNLDATYMLPRLGMANARRDAINLALVHCRDNHYFYCDFDRLIFWISNYPDELKETINQTADKDYTVIGRTYLAKQSHPEFQLKTEGIMSLIVKERAGLDMDVFAGAKSFSHQVAKWLSKQSTSQDAAQDVEWPLIVKENGGEVRYIEVNGLAYESSMLGIEKTPKREFDLRVKNLKSVVEFLGG